MVSLPRSESLHIQAALHLAHQRPHHALTAIRQSLELASGFSQRNTLAVCLLNCGQAQEAAVVLEELTEEHPENPDLWFNLARSLGHGEAALQAARVAVRLRPDWRQAELLLVSILASHGHFDEALAWLRRDMSTLASRLLEAQLVFGMGRYRSAALLCLGLLQESSEVQALALLVQSLLAAEEVPRHELIPDVLERALGLPGAYSLIPSVLRAWPGREGLLLALLRHDLVTDMPLERWLTEWRRDFRFHPRPGELAEALALHNFTNEFCFLETPEEIDGLQPDHPAYPLYRPLPEGQPGPPAVMERHQLEPAQERALQDQFVLSNPDCVARQYQQNPYPRWRTLERLAPPRAFHLELGGICPGVTVPSFERLNILVAGCGTGRHALLCAQRFAQAQVWALDLSAPSLAYGLRQSQRLGIDNVKFLAGDLLALEELALPASFEVIECVGVLHHLRDPGAGLAALVTRLRVDGWMRLGFYSRLARQGLEPARRMARQLQSLSLKQVRARLIQDLNPQDLEFLAGIKDFFSLSGLRDLLLHEREQEFDLAELAHMLTQNGLEFVAFDSLPAPVLHRFRLEFGPQNLGNLDCWQQFEQKHPRTFLGMYVFWCRRQIRTTAITATATAAAAASAAPTASVAPATLA